MSTARNSSASRSAAAAAHNAATDLSPPIVVQKFGGTSVADAAKLRASAQHVLAALDAGRRVVVVVSAMGDATDDLLDLARSVHAGDVALTNTSGAQRELDQLLSTGEQVSAALMALTLRALGREAVSLTGAQVGIVTDAVFTRATITAIDGSSLRALLDRGVVPVVTGFQGVTLAGDTTTLGRGGSDTTAVALAAHLGGSVEIYKDVDGVFTADPRIEPAARKLDAVTYDEMLEAAALGSQVLHPRAVELAKAFGTPVRVLHSQERAGRVGAGTVIIAEDPNHDRPVTSVVLKKHVGRVSIRGVVNRAGVQSEVFSPLAAAHIPVDDIIQEDDGAGTIGLTFTLDRQDMTAMHETIQASAQRVGAQALRLEEGLSTVSAVGSGMRTQAGVAARLFAALAGEGVAIENITTSEIRVSCVVRESDGPRATRAIHKAFGLDQPEAAGASGASGATSAPRTPAVPASVDTPTRVEFKPASARAGASG